MVVSVVIVLSCFHVVMFSCCHVFMLLSCCLVGVDGTGIGT